MSHVFKFHTCRTVLKLSGKNISVCQSILQVVLPCIFLSSLWSVLSPPNELSFRSFYLTHSTLHQLSQIVVCIFLELTNKLPFSPVLLVVVLMDRNKFVSAYERRKLCVWRAASHTMNSLSYPQLMADDSAGLAGLARAREREWERDAYLISTCFCQPLPPSLFPALLLPPLLFTFAVCHLFEIICCTGHPRTSFQFTWLIVIWLICLINDSSLESISHFPAPFPWFKASNTPKIIADFVNQFVCMWLHFPIFAAPTSVRTHPLF